MGNSNSGPKRRPNTLQLLHGVTRKDRLNPHEPKPPELPVERPETLSEAAKVEWDALSPICLAMGTLTAADVPAFAALCELQATLHQASRQKDGDGFQVFSETGNVHGAIRLERETATALRPFYDYFGMTPSGRARLTVPKKADEPVSKWAGALK